MWTDSHAHLDFPEIQADLPAVLSRARDEGVDRIMTIGCIGEDPSTIDRVVAIAEANPGVFAALGTHPHDAVHYTSALGDAIQERMTHPKVLAWGEIGLDYHYDNSPREKQKEAFRDQIRRAREASKPIVIHTREAEEDTLAILREFYGEDSAAAGVLHCFTSGLEMARRGLALGFYIGMGGILTFNRAEDLREVARQAPLERLLVETDSPYLAPVPHRGKRNEPSFVALVGRKLAEVLERPEQEVAQATSLNFERLFGGA